MYLAYLINADIILTIKLNQIIKNDTLGKRKCQNIQIIQLLQVNLRTYTYKIFQSGYFHFWQNNDISITMYIKDPHDFFLNRYTDNFNTYTTYRKRKYVHLKI